MDLIIDSVTGGGRPRRRHVIKLYLRYIPHASYVSSDENQRKGQWTGGCFGRVVMAQCCPRLLSEPRDEIHTTQTDRHFSLRINYLIRRSENFVIRMTLLNGRKRRLGPGLKPLTLRMERSSPNCR